MWIGHWVAARPPGIRAAELAAAVVWGREEGPNRLPMMLASNTATSAVDQIRIRDRARVLV